MSIDQKSLQACLEYIHNYWSKIIYQPEETQGDPHLIPLPHPFLSPNARDTSTWKGTMFYWDSFFMFRGILDTEYEKIIPGMVDNYIYLLNTYGIIPNASSWGFLVSSQPPFLSSMMFDAYYSLVRGTKITSKLKTPYAKLWLKKRIKNVQKEYWTVWEDVNSYHHRVEEFGLSRYGDRDVGYPLNAERESGWDFTTRFYSRCQEFLPIDLNSYLHKYEKDFAKAAHILGDNDEEIFWDQRAQARHDRMKKYMWNEEKGFFFDYDYINNKQSEFYSLAGFVPLWAKLATPEEAEKAVKNLPKFETEYGLTITAKESMPDMYDLNGIPDAFKRTIVEMLKPKQWDYPHIWAPLEYLTVMGLLRYGYIDDAVRIMTKSINANLHIFEKYGALLEKIDVTTGEKAQTFWYPSQLGFGWTNAIFHRYVKILDYIKDRQGNIYSDESLAQGAPYSLTSILH